MVAATNEPQIYLYDTVKNLKMENIQLDKKPLKIAVDSKNNFVAYILDDGTINFYDIANK